MNDEEYASPTIGDLPESERPGERLLHGGPDNLSSAELLAVILRTGSQRENGIRLAERVLSRLGGLQGLLSAAPRQLESIHGLGASKRAQILALAELVRRASNLPAPEQPVIRQSADAARLVMDMATLAQEHVRVLLLDARRRCTGIHTVYIGTVSATAVRAAEIYREAVTRNAPALIVAHNHPTGDPSPSPEDVALTRSLAAAGRVLDIQLIDHLIIGRGEYRSLRELKLGF